MIIIQRVCTYPAVHGSSGAQTTDALTSCGSVIRTMIVWMGAMRPSASAVRLGANLTCMVLVPLLCLMLSALVIFAFRLFIFVG